jgi:hypothetical protein
MGGRRRRHSTAGNAVMNHGQGAAARAPGVLDAVGDSLKATAATAVAGMLAEFIPGFREEHDRRRR